MARNDEDPLAEKRRARKLVPTFRVAAETVHKEHAKAWKNAKHGDQWINTLKVYAYPAFGDRRVDQIDTPEILKALSPIWLTRQETARRVRQRIGTVLDWAKAAGFRSGNNPVEDISKALPRQSERKGHHAALPYIEVPAFARKLHDDGDGTIANLAFEFLILTAGRTGEDLCWIKTRPYLVANAFKATKAFWEAHVAGIDASAAFDLRGCRRNRTHNTLCLHRSSWYGADPLPLIAENAFRPPCAVAG